MPKSACALHTAARDLVFGAAPDETQEALLDRPQDFGCLGRCGARCRVDELALEYVDAIRYERHPDRLERTRPSAAIRRELEAEVRNERWPPPVADAEHAPPGPGSGDPVREPTWKLS